MKIRAYLLIFFVCLFLEVNLYGKHLNSDSTAFLHDLSNDTSQTNEEYNTLNKFDIVALNYENASRGFIWEPSLYINDMGTPGRLSFLSYRGGNIRETGFSLNGIPIISPLTESQDVNLLPVSLINKIQIYSCGNPLLSIQSQSSHAAVFSPASMEKTPFTEITYRVGDYARKFVDVFFQRKVTSRTGVGIIADFNSFPGEYSDQNYDGKHFWVSVDHKINERWFVNGWTLTARQGINDNLNYITVPALTDGTYRFNNNRTLYALQILRLPGVHIWQLKADFFGSRSSRAVKHSTLSDKFNQDEDYDGAMLNVERSIHKGQLNLTVNGVSYRILEFNKRNLSHYLLGISFGMKKQIKNRNELLFRSGIRKDEIRGNLFVFSGNWRTKITNRTSLAAKYGQFGRFISYQERFFSEYQFNRLSVELKPVRYKEGEIGFTFQNNSPLRVKLVTFQRNYSHDYNLFSDYYFGWRTSDSYSGVNRQIRGMELSTSIAPGSLLQFSESFTVQKSAHSSGFAWVPSYYGVTGITFNDLQRWLIPYALHTKVHLILRYFGQNGQLTYFPLPVEYAQTPVLARSKRLLDIKGTIAIKSFEGFYEVDNLFGTIYEPILNYPIPARTIRIGIRWQFLN